MPRANEELEELLTEWADLLQISGADAFRVRAYEKAARAIGGHSHDVRGLSDKELRAIPAVGAHMAARVREYVETGSMHELEDLREQVPAGVRDLMRIPGLGPKRAMLLHEEIGVSAIADLIQAIQSQRVREIKGLGEKTEENLLRGIENLRRSEKRVRLDDALRAAEQVVEDVRVNAPLDAITVAGSLRRMRETIGDLDILVAADVADPVMEAFVSMSSVATVLARGETKTSIVTRAGLQVDLRVVPSDAWGAALVYFTGSKAHNVKIREMAVAKGLKLSEWGLFRARDGARIAARTEEDVYEALGLPWIPPTMREDSGEVEAARAGTLPAPVQVPDVRGDLHTHTNLTDGLASLDDMVSEAAARGYAYYAITDHAEDLAMTGMKRDAVLAQREAIRALQARTEMRLLHGCELNIGRDGSVDYDPDFLAGFDLTVASVHSLFRLSREETTRRLVTAMENPNVGIIGHPSGRLIGRREPIDADFDEVFAAAARTGTAMEVNCFPDRLDLRDEHVRWAVERGVTIVISTDAHAPIHLENMRFGVATAQRGWARAADVLNTRPANDVSEFLARKRRRA